MTADQKIWAHFKNHFITAYHKIKKQSKGQVNHIMKGVIPALIVYELQQVSTRFYEEQQQLANFVNANTNLKELVEAHNRKITSLEKTSRALDKKSKEGNQKNDEKNSKYWQ